MNELDETDSILKKFGFDIDEKSNYKTPDLIALEIKSGKQYLVKTVYMMQISEFINHLYEPAKKNIETIVKLPSVIDEKYMDFLTDYLLLVERGIPALDSNVIKNATTLKAALGESLFELFVKHFEYVDERSDIAVKKYLQPFGYFLKCSASIIANPLITTFIVAHKCIIQHLPSSSFLAKIE
jgi:hypothetical protein